MNLNEYQEAAKKTASYHGCLTPPEEVASLDKNKLESLIYCSLGLAGEAGEVVENTKKLLRDDASELTKSRRNKFLGELGDVMWYVANLASALGFTLEEVATYNRDKLEARYRGRDVDNA